MFGGGGKCPRTSIIPLPLALNPQTPPAPWLRSGLRGHMKSTPGGRWSESHLLRKEPRAPSELGIGDGVRGLRPSAVPAQALGVCAATLSPLQCIQDPLF